MLEEERNRPAPAPDEMDPATAALIASMRENGEIETEVGPGPAAAAGDGGGGARGGGQTAVGMINGRGERRVDPVTLPANLPRPTRPAETSIVVISSDSDDDP